MGEIFHALTRAFTFTRCLSAREASRAIWRSVRIKSRPGRKLDGLTGEQRKNVGSHAIRT